MEPRRSRTMEYDSVTGCYVRKVPLDFTDKKVEDIVKEEMTKSERKSRLHSRNPGDKEESSSDTALVNLSQRTSEQNKVKSLPHYVSGEDMETEYNFTVKQTVQTETKPAAGLDKNGEFADEDIKKAGEEIKAKFDGDRMKFERDSGEVGMSERSKRSFERRHRNDEDSDSKKVKEDTKERRQSLDRRLKGMEERRARLFKGSPEDKTDSGEVIITRTVNTETSYSTPASEDSMLGDRMQDAHRRHRNREERIRRRKQAEEIISKSSSAGDDKPAIKSTGVKLELRGSAFKKREDLSSNSDLEPNAFSGSSYSYHQPEDDASDITFTVKKSAETRKDEDGIQNFDKKETALYGDEKSRSKTTESKNTSASLMDEPIVWSQPGFDYPGLGTNDNISFTVKESSKTKEDDESQKEKENKRENKRSRIKETEVKVVESKSVQSLFSSDFGEEEPKDIVFSVKDTPSSTKRNALDGDKEDSDLSKSKPKELTLERGTFDDKYSFTSSSNSDLLRWETDNVDSSKQPSEPETGDITDGYKDSLIRNNALGRVGSFKKSRDDLPPAKFHDIESDAPAAPMVDIRTESPSPVSRGDSKIDTVQAPNILSKFQEEDVDDERRRRRLEIEEKKKRIAESQRKVNVQRRREVSDTEKKNDAAAAAAAADKPELDDSSEDLSEKRRSLLMMWESYAEGEGPGPENHDLVRETKSQPFGYDVMMMEASQSDSKPGVVGYRTMDVEDENEETRTPMVDSDEYHRLDDDELKWERAGQFQPGRLKTKFHEMGKDDSASKTGKTWQGMNNNTTEVTSKVFSDDQRFKTTVEEDQSYVEETPEMESSPKLLWDENEGQSTSKSDDENEKDMRKPHVDVDEVHHMTHEEAKWEKVGHYQPGKINTSVFESRKEADQNENVGSTKIQKREQSRYEQIKKIQRTNSKKELLVPKKVALRSDRHEDVNEEDEHERPHVGKIEAPLFHGTVSEEERQRRERETRNRREMEEIQREKEEERRRQERENLEAMTSVNEFEDDEFDAKVKSKDVRKIDITKFGDFHKSSEPIPEVKPVSKQSSKRIVYSRGEDKIESVTKTTSYGKEDDGFDIQFQQGDAAAREKPERKTSDKYSKRGYVQQPDVVVAQSTREVESAPEYRYEDDEYEIKRRSVGKLNKDWLAQSQEQEAKEIELRRKESDMERIRKEQYEIEFLQMEEKRRRENEGDEVLRDESYLSEKPQGVKKLDSTTMSPFLSGGRPSPEGAGGLSRPRRDKDEVRQERKLARKESRSKIQTPEALYAVETDDVQQSPESFDDRQKEVGRLNTGKYLQMMGEDLGDKERRKKLLEEERTRRELEEMERQREEEQTRKEMDSDGTSSSCSSDKPQNVNKLDLAQFSQFQKQDTVVMPKKLPTKEITRETNKESRVEIIEKQTTDEVESEPLVPESSDVEWLENERNEDLRYEEKRQNVGRLDVNRLMQARSDEEQERISRIKELERQRIIKEREEIERLKAEKKKGNQSADLDSDISTETSRDNYETPPVKRSDSQHDREREEEWTVEEKRKSGVGRLNVGQFMQSLSKEEEEKNMRKVELERERIRREAEERENLRIEQQMSSESITISSVQEVHSAPDEGFFYGQGNKEEREREEELTVEEKRKSVGRLDVNKFVQSISEEAQEKRGRKIELEKERIRRENEERELLRLEQEIKNMEESSVAASEESSRNYVVLHQYSAASGDQRGERKEQRSSDEEKYSSLERERDAELSVEEKRKSVGRLDFNRFTQSLGQEEEEKRRRMIELERVRRRREEEEKELLRLEQERGMVDDTSRSTSTNSAYEQVSSTVVNDVQSSPYDQLDEDVQHPSRIDKEREEGLSVEEKMKSVGKLNVNKFFQSLSEEDEQKRRRRAEMENERIRHENHERELLRMEQEKSRGNQAVEQVSASVVQEVHSAPSADLIFIDDDKRSSLEREREEAMSVEEKRKSVGKLNVNQFMQSISKEDKEKQMRKIELERERVRREQEERESEEKELRLRESSSYSETIQSSSDEKRTYRDDEVDRRLEEKTESTKSDESSDIDKPVPRKLDLSKFSAFQSGSGRRVTKDDSSVERREISEASRQARPKSFAGSSFKGVANGDAKSGEREFRIIH